MTWSESVNYIDNSAFVGSKTPLGFIDVGLPPHFISSIENWNATANGSHQILYESPVNYLYIPESCRRVFHIGFGNMPLKALEIEPWDNNILKENWWLRDQEEPDNIAFGTDYYNSFETVADNLRDKYMSGIGIEVSDTISLKPATKDTLGGVKAGESRSDIKNSYGKLSLEKADLSTFGGLQLGKGLYPSPTDSHGYGIVDVNLGKGLVFVEQESEKGAEESNTGENGTEGNTTEGTGSQENDPTKHMSAVEVKIGDGLRFDEEESDYGKIHLNLGNGLAFGERKYEKKKGFDGNDTEENDLTRYTSELEVKIGTGLRFGENGELIAEGSAYTAGENITISEDGKISADVKEYTAGENITISEDGKISATGEGITIDQAVIIKEADAKYLLHNFTEIEYNSGSHIQTLRGLVGKNYFGCDCVGLIKSYYWSGNPDGGTGSPNYGKAGFPDVNAHGMYNAAKVKGTIDTIPEVPGLVVYCKSHPHVGVYTGNGNTIESTLGGGFDGVVKRKLKDWIWEYWFQCPYITYEKTATEATTEIATEKKCTLAYHAVVRAAPKASAAQLGRYNPGMTVTILPGSETRDEKTGYIYVKIKRSTGEAWIVKSAIKS